MIFRFNMPVSRIADFIWLVMRDNWQKMDVEAIQMRWCCSEYPALWKERWDKIFVEFCDVEPEKFDPSRISELYDSIKYDALHNQVFLETIFTPMDMHESSTPDKAVSTLKPPKKLKELYANAKILFDYSNQSIFSRRSLS